MTEETTRLNEIVTICSLACYILASVKIIFWRTPNHITNQIVSYNKTNWMHYYLKFILE